MTATVVVLGAGMGARLMPLTADRPKCAVAIGGEPLAARVVRQLHARGVGRAVIVVGYQAARASALIGDALAGRPGLALEFVENAEFATTNTMYSTLLAIDALAGGGYLVEGDIVASELAIDRLVAADAARSHWAVSPWTVAHTGSRLYAGADRRIVHQEIWRAATTGDLAGLWKSAGMLKLAPVGAAALHRALAADAAAGHRTLYYDDVVGRHVDELALDVLDLGAAPWVEIDDAVDLAEARRLFAPEEAAS